MDGVDFLKTATFACLSRWDGTVLVSTPHFISSFAPPPLPFLPSTMKAFGILRCSSHCFRPVDLRLH